MAVKGRFGKIGRAEDWECLFHAALNCVKIIRLSYLKSLQEGVVSLFGAYGGLGTVTGKDRGVIVER